MLRIPEVNGQSYNCGKSCSKSFAPKKPPKGKNGTGDQTPSQTEP